MKKQHFTLHELGAFACLIGMFGFYATLKHNSGFFFVLLLAGIALCIFAGFEYEARENKGEE